MWQLCLRTRREKWGISGGNLAGTTIDYALVGYEIFKIGHFCVEFICKSVLYLRATPQMIGFSVHYFSNINYEVG